MRPRRESRQPASRRTDPPEPASHHSHFGNVRDGRLLKLPYGVMEVIDGGPHDAHIPVAGGNGGGQFSIRGLDAGLECDPPGREARLNSLDTDALIGVKRQIAVNDGMQRGRRIAFLHPGAPAPRPPAPWRSALERRCRRPTSIPSTSPTLQPRERECSNMNCSVIPRHAPSP